MSDNPEGPYSFKEIVDLRARIAELEQELALVSRSRDNAITNGETLEEENTRLKEQARVRGERMEEMLMTMKLLSIGTHPEAAGMSKVCGYFTDNGKVRD